MFWKSGPNKKASTGISHFSLWTARGHRPVLYNAPAPSHTPGRLRAPPGAPRAPPGGLHDYKHRFTPILPCTHTCIHAHTNTACGWNNSHPHMCTCNRLCQLQTSTYRYILIQYPDGTTSTGICVHATDHTYEDNSSCHMHTCTYRYIQIRSRRQPGAPAATR